MSTYDVFNEKCPSHNVLAAVSDKWSILIIQLLMNNTLRFGELRRALNGLSTKMAAQTLSKLVELHLLHKTIFNEKPLRVEYSLTPLGRELSIILQQLTTWTESRMHLLTEA